MRANKRTTVHRPIFACILTFVLDRGEFSASRSIHITPGDNYQFYLLDKRLFGPHIRFGLVRIEKNPFHCRKSNSDHLARHQLLFKLSYPGSVIVNKHKIINVNYVIRVKVHKVVTEGYNLLGCRHVVW
jgi:hypothetical protein